MIDISNGYVEDRVYPTVSYALITSECVLTYTALTTTRKVYTEELI